MSGEYTNVILTIPHSKNIRCFRWAKANNSFQDLSAEKDKKRLAVRCWNLRLSESRDKLAWTMPSVSKLNNVKQVQHDEMIISMRRGNVGTSACSVRGFYSRKSRQRFGVIFREIREIITQCILFGRCTQTSLPPSPLITHRLSLIAQKPMPIPVFADGGCVWDVWIPRVQEPAAIRPYGHRVLQTPLLIYNYRKEKTSGRREHE